MSKGLKALHRIKMLEISCDRESYDLKPITKTHKEDLKTIEKELKEYEGAKNHIEALHKERVENSLKIKALEIIKEKLIDVGRLYGCMVAYPHEKTSIHYNEDIDKRYKRYMLTQEEYDLLKEVLL